MSFNKNEKAKLLSEIIADIGDISPLSSIINFNFVVNALAIVLGPYLSKQVIIKKIENGNLILHSESSSVRSEILLRKPQIIKSLNKHPNVEKIKGISFI